MYELINFLPNVFRINSAIVMYLLHLINSDMFNANYFDLHSNHNSPFICIV